MTMMTTSIYQHSPCVVRSWYYFPLVEPVLPSLGSSHLGHRDMGTGRHQILEEDLGSGPISPGGARRACRRQWNTIQPWPAMAGKKKVTAPAIQSVHGLCTSLSWKNTNISWVRLRQAWAGAVDHRFGTLGPPNALVISNSSMKVLTEIDEVTTFPRSCHFPETWMA